MPPGGESLEEGRLRMIRFTTIVSVWFCSFEEGFIRLGMTRSIFKLVHLLEDDQVWFGFSSS